MGQLLRHSPRVFEARLEQCLERLLEPALFLVEPRYVAVGLAVICLSLFAAVRWPRINAARNVGVALVLAVSATSGVALVKDGVKNLGVCGDAARSLQTGGVSETPATPSNC